MRVAPKVDVSDEQRQVLCTLATGRRTEVRVALRAKIILAASTGLENTEIASELGVTRETVGRWRDRFIEAGVEGITQDLPRGGRKPTARSKAEGQIIEVTTQRKPLNATHWSTRSLAEELGVTQSMVHRVWKANGLKPHLVKTFKVSNDPHFEEKLRDIVGLYMNPPENALVLSADEKTSIQALDRTQPSLPLVKGRCGTMTHDYKRNGTTTLFAAMELVHGEVIATCMQRHRHQEWIKFLAMIDQQTPRELDLHVIVDNYATHKHAKVKLWLKQHPRFHIHFIPTSSSWLNIVEGFFRNLDANRLKRSAFRSVPQLIEAIMDYIESHNDNPRPIVWMKAADEILEKVGRARAKLDKAGTE
ncbi:MAG: IS630 family transposase [Aquimonas sp.]|nr:IS630 family transposase [Aquimonas sp.]